MGLPPVRVELIAEIKEFLARMKEAEHAMGKVGDRATYTKEKMAALGQKMATGVIAGFGGTMVLATKYAYEYQKSLEEIGLQANVSEEELHRLHDAVLTTSSATATSTDEIAKAYLQVEKAGIKGAQADTMVTQAAMLAKVAHADLNKTISAGIVIQQLGIAKGMNTVQMYDALYGAVKNSKLSLDELTSVFQGKAALAISNYGIKLNEVAGVAGVFKKANMDAGAGMAGLQLALAKLTTRNAKANDTLKEVGLTQAQIAADLKKPNGLVTMFQDLSTHIGKAGVPMQQFLNSLAGTRGAQGVGFLLGQMQQLKELSGPSGVSVNNAFSEWLKNPEGALQNFKTVAQNTLIGLGNMLLPKVTDGLNFLNAVMAKFKTDKNWQTVGTVVGGAILAGIAASKLALLGNGIAAAFGVEAEILAGPIGVAIAAGIVGYFGLKHIIDTNKNGLTDTKNRLDDPYSSDNIPKYKGNPTKAPKGQQLVNEIVTPAYGAGIYGIPATMMKITNLQKQALDAYASRHKDFVPGSQSWINAVGNFSRQDKKGNYSVVVNVH